MSVVKRTQRGLSDLSTRSASVSCVGLPRRSFREDKPSPSFGSQSSVYRQNASELAPHDGQLAGIPSLRVLNSPQSSQRHVRCIETVRTSSGLRGCPL